MMKKPVTRLDYCQYLLVSQINYTISKNQKGFVKKEKRVSS